MRLRTGLSSGFLMLEMETLLKRCLFQKMIAGHCVYRPKRVALLGVGFALQATKVLVET
jgi:hypothetical protein